ncbi:AAA family ATPase [Synoicihabitans lomoniglobus]|uniref:ATP-binding protein n=1 Tax=Synoicihabitans lomoniglobus TaxID=2909285 RepID=A0AAF0CMT9_9BACT|nr:ATP-binding protein [Opitutaceae bacterium LMO-M01]WED63771.1 ATP-binding protein [Opitutaceae bacterium LMO-M01]
MANHITLIEFRRYKAFRHYSVRIADFSVLVGPNNAGKSTVLGAFRLLSEALKKAYSRKPEWVPNGDSGEFGYRIDLEGMPVSTENVFYNYDDSEPASIIFKIDNGNSLRLVFPERGICSLIPEAKRAIRSVANFKREFDLSIVIVPILGPVEHNELLYQKEAARLALRSPFGSRNFRNIWYHYPENFEEFRSLLVTTWPGMDIQRPERNDSGQKPMLHMFCPEDRYPREIFWAGFGFQVWCQMLTHLVQAQEGAHLIIDEPDIYLHSDLQRQLVNILRDRNCRVILATHSTEIISEVDPRNILNINKYRKAARAVRNVKEIQEIFSVLGSNANPTLTQIAKCRRVLYVEGKDFTIIAGIARVLRFAKIANRSDFAVVPVHGFNPPKVRDFSEGVEATLGMRLEKAVLFDRDYRCSAEVRKIENALKKVASLVSILQRKEIENYLLIPELLLLVVNAERRRYNLSPLVEYQVLEVVGDSLEEIRIETQVQYQKSYRDYCRAECPGKDSSTCDLESTREFEQNWKEFDGRVKVVSGKEAISRINGRLQENYSVHISVASLLAGLKRNMIPDDMIQFIRELNDFRQKGSEVQLLD